MNYIQVTFELHPLLPAREILMAELSELPFDTFEETESGLNAWIREDAFRDEILASLIVNTLEDTTVKISSRIIPTENWNAKWESNFEPIAVDDLCYVRAPFHEPNALFGIDIVIEPKMSFGTGHHATTFLMLRKMFDLDLTDKEVLDMGSGTAVLAILAEKLGAYRIHAIDIDDWAVENARENVARNSCHRIVISHGGSEAIAGKFHAILANINRNVLVNDMPAYLDALLPGGDLLLSGFYESDVSLLTEAAGAGMDLIGKMSRDQWCLLHFRKKY